MLSNLRCWQTPLSALRTRHKPPLDCPPRLPCRSKQESPHEVAILQVVGVRDLPEQEQELEEAHPLPKRRRTQGAEEAAGPAPTEAEAAAEEAAGEAGEAGEAEEAEAAAEAAAPQSPEEQAALLAEAQAAPLLGMAMRLLMPVAVELGRDRAVLPQLRRWASQLEEGDGAGFVEPDLDSPATVWKVRWVGRRRAGLGWHLGLPEVLASRFVQGHASFAG